MANAVLTKQSLPEESGLLGLGVGNNLTTERLHALQHAAVGGTNKK